MSIINDIVNFVTGRNQAPQQGAIQSAQNTIAQQQRQQIGWKDAPGGGGYLPVFNTDQSPTPQYRNLPNSDKPTPQAVQQAQQIVSNQQSGNGFQINVPGPNGNVQVPSQVSQLLGNEFNGMNEATNAARVLVHPNQITAIGNEKQMGVNTVPNNGENPGFATKNIDAVNEDGSVDRGLFRINSNTFNDYMSTPGNAARLKALGIKSYSDMDDANKNAAMARLIYQDRGWSGWYASPADLRNGVKGLITKK